MNKSKAHLLVAAGLALIALLASTAMNGRAPKRNPTFAINQTAEVTFNMIVSAGAAACLPDATATVTITPAGPVEVMDVSVSNLPPNNEFDLFVLQVPTGPFGVAWYQGDIETDDNGQGSGEFVGRFSIETFAVAQPPGNQPAPVVHDQPPSFPDADINPPFEPIHTYHLGLWVRLGGRSGGGGLPEHANALQWRSHGRDSGAEHP